MPMVTRMPPTASDRNYALAVRVCPRGNSFSLPIRKTASSATSIADPARMAIEKMAELKRPTFVFHRIDGSMSGDIAGSFDSLVDRTGLQPKGCGGGARTRTADLGIMRPSL